MKLLAEVHEQTLSLNEQLVVLFALQATFFVLQASSLILIFVYVLPPLFFVQVHLPLAFSVAPLSSIAPP
jgi:hypothetical protein